MVTLILNPIIPILSLFHCALDGGNQNFVVTFCQSCAGQNKKSAYSFTRCEETSTLKQTYIKTGIGNIDTL